MKFKKDLLVFGGMQLQQMILLRLIANITNLKSVFLNETVDLQYAEIHMFAYMCTHFCDFISLSVVSELLDVTGNTVSKDWMIDSCVADSDGKWRLQKTAGMKDLL